MAQHGAVLFLQHAGSNIDDQIRTYPQEVSVEGGVMELAQGQPVTNRRQSTLMVRDNMGRVQELLVSQGTDCAVSSVRFQDAASEAGLVESLLGKDRDIVAAGTSAAIGHLCES